MLFVIMLCLGLLTHSLFISNYFALFARCFNSVGFQNFMFAPFFMEGLSGEIALTNDRYYYHYFSTSDKK